VTFETKNRVPRAPVSAALLALVLGACQFDAVERDIELREVGLLVPSAIREVEAPADRVTVLHPSGRTTVMEQVVIRRDGAHFWLVPVDTKRAPIELAADDVQAFEIERWTRGEKARLKVKDGNVGVETDGSFVNVFGGMLIGVGLLGGLLLAVDAAGGN